MKRAAAILLSLMFVWLQTLASAQTSFARVSPGRSCCSCDKSCCVSAAEPDSQPSPVAPISSSTPNDFSAWVTAAVAWTLPTTSPAPIISAAGAPFSAPGVPLFTRHCALLI